MKVVFVLSLCLLGSYTLAAEQAEKIFQRFESALYQIKIIDKASGEKSSYGTGFQISREGLIATNYHVISSYAQYPDKYTIEYSDSEGNTATLALLSVDVINDLALLKGDVDPKDGFFELADSAPTKGEEIFSLGNPHELGMIVVPGTYNGLKKESFYDRIHFTGAINSGMSGGPVVDEASHVVGINVASSGNQIGFLIPHDKLAALVERHNVRVDEEGLEPNENELETIDEQISEQLHDNQDQMISSILAAPWEIRELGNAQIPNIDVPFIRCWGNSNADKTEALVLRVSSQCASNEYVYIASDFSTGTIHISFLYLDAKELSDLRFYSLYQKNISLPTNRTYGSKEQLTEYQCRDEIYTAKNPSNTESSIKGKVIFCSRSYLDTDNLFDVVYVSASLDRTDEALISRFELSGVDIASAHAFMKKFMESSTWK